MGMYTEIVLGVALKRDTPKEVIDILNYMIDHEIGDVISNLPSHPLFKTYGWYRMLISDYCIFGGCSNSILKEPRHSFDNWHLSIRSNLKNYDSEIELFLNWLNPYMETVGFIGYMRHEEFDDPWLIYHSSYDDDDIHLYKIEELDEMATLDDKWLADRVR